MSAVRAKSAGVTANIVTFPVPPGVSPAVSPDVRERRRVIVERPVEPVRRTCPTCGATFDDFTQRPNTRYCRSSCRVKMSGIKKQTAIQTLAAISHAPESAISDTVEKIGLAVAEKLLLRFGYTFDISAKTWVKKERS